MQKFLNKIRRFVRKKFRSLGFQRRIAPDFFDVMVANNIDVIFDVGANDGDYGREIRDSGYKGLIVSFEPNPAAYKRLLTATANDSNWITYPLALGEIDGHLELSIAENDVMSSLKELTTFGKDTGANPVSQALVKITRLDSFLKLHPELMKNIYLKIDTQGYEIEVLRGAGKKLEDILAVQTEIALIHTYKDELDWLEMLTWMRNNKFEVVTAICNSRVGAQIREFDFVFVRRENIAMRF